MKTTHKPARFFIQRFSVPFAKPFWNLYERLPASQWSVADMTSRTRFIQEFKTKREALAALRSTGQE